MTGRTDDRGQRARSKAGKLVFLGFALIALYFLYSEHRAHLFAALPYLLLAACPLMHLFHHGHHHHDHDDDDKDEHGRDLDPTASSAPTRHDR